MKLERFPASTRRDVRTADAPRPRTVIFGDSHVHALQLALATLAPDPDGVTIEARRLLKTKAGKAGPATTLSTAGRLRHFASSLWRGRPDGPDTPGPRTLGDTTFAEFLTIAKGLQTSDMLVSAVGGNQHAVFSTIQHPVPFDFNFPEDVAAPYREEIEVVPFGSLYDHFRIGLRDGDGATLAALTKATRARVVHLMAPPPKRNGDYIAHNHDTHFASEGIAALGVSSAALRMKFWRLQNRALAEICADLGIEFLAPPAAACDADGFLAEPFYARDATHANAAYGKLVIDQLQGLAAGTGR